VYDRHDVVALGEMHARKTDSDLRIALVRHPDFARKVRTIVVEFGATAEQTTLDRYRRKYVRCWYPCSDRHSEISPPRSSLTERS